jgi:hypothetical protein
MRWTCCPIREDGQERRQTHGPGITSLGQRLPGGSMSGELEDIVVTRVLRISDASTTVHRRLHPHGMPILVDRPHVENDLLYLLMLRKG